MHTTTTFPDAEGTRFLAIALVAVVLVAAVLSAGTLFVRPQSLSPRVQLSSTNHISDDVKTSFGIVAVEFVRQVDGLTTRSLAGASHGVSGLVKADQAQIQVALAVTNRTQVPFQYTSNQVRLLVTYKNKTTVQKVGGGDLPDVRVLPHAGVEGHLNFTVPRKDASMVLSFNDPGRSKPILIDLGSANFTTRAGHTH